MKTKTFFAIYAGKTIVKQQDKAGKDLIRKQLLFRSLSAWTFSLIRKPELNRSKLWDYGCFIITVNNLLIFYSILKFRSVLYSFAFSGKRLYLTRSWANNRANISKGLYSAQKVVVFSYEHIWEKSDYFVHLCISSWSSYPNQSIPGERLGAAH